MIWENSKSMPLAQSIAVVVEGKEMCGICESIVALQAACEEVTAFWVQLIKLPLILLLVARLFVYFHTSSRFNVHSIRLPDSIIALLEPPPPKPF